MKLLINKKITLSNFLILVVLVFALTAFVDISTRTIINAKIFFELLFIFIFFIIFTKLKVNKQVVPYLFIILIYLLYSLNEFILIENVAKVSDYLLIYKSFIYLFILSFFIGTYYLNNKFLRLFLNILLVLFLSKYILMKLFGYGFEGRPDLFVENNFELPMLLIIYIGVYSREKMIYKWDLIFLVIIFILSGSRSGVGAFFIMLYFIDFSDSKKLKFLKLFLLSVAFLGIIIIFLQRLGASSIEDIDRVQFFFYFLKEIDTWGIYNYLFGASFLTPMSYETSKALSYYQVLYSDYDQLLTYSVVLHSFVLRTIFDHGLVGFWFLFYTVWKFLEYSGYDKNERKSLILILIATGLSVSSLNSVFVIFSLGLIIITRRSSAIEHKL